MSEECYRYDKHTLVLNDKRLPASLDAVPPVDANVKEIIDDAIHRIKDAGCKIRWRPTKDYVKNKKALEAAKRMGYHLWTFQIAQSCTDLADKEEDKLGSMGINFDIGTGFGWRDWEFDCIILKDKLTKVDIETKRVLRKITKDAFIERR